MPQVIVLVAVPALLAFAAASDLVSMTISNRIPIALGIGFIFAAGLTGMSMPDIGMHCASGFLVLTICFALFAAGVIGGGDAKLAAAIALWIGFPFLLSWALASAILGGALTLAILKMRGMPLPSLLERQDWVKRLYNPQAGVPYGIALSLAALAVFPQTIWFAALA